MDSYIMAEATGTASELASKLNISERHVYNYLRAFGEVGRESYYDVDKRSYIYKDPLCRV